MATEVNGHLFDKQVLENQIVPLCVACSGFVKHGIRRCSACKCYIHKKCLKKAPPCRCAPTPPPSQENKTVGWSPSLSRTDSVIRNSRRSVKETSPTASPSVTQSLSRSSGHAFSIANMVAGEARNRAGSNSGSAIPSQQQQPNPPSQVTLTPIPSSPPPPSLTSSASQPQSVTTLQSIKSQNLSLMLKRIQMKSRFGEEHLIEYEKKWTGDHNKRNGYVDRRKAALTEFETLWNDIDTDWSAAKEANKEVFDTAEDICERTSNLSEKLSKINEAGNPNSLEIEKILESLDKSTDVVELMKWDDKWLADEGKYIEDSTKALMTVMKELRKRKDNIDKMVESKKQVLQKVKQLESHIQSLNRAVSGKDEKPEETENKDQAPSQTTEQVTGEAPPTSTSEPTTEAKKPVTVESELSAMNALTADIAKAMKEHVPEADAGERITCLYNLPLKPAPEGKDTSEIKFQEPDNTDAPEAEAEQSDIQNKERSGTNFCAKAQVIRAATVNRLVERLAYDSYSDNQFQRSFFLTYRSVMTPKQLLEKLALRYTICMSYSDFNSQSAQWADKEGTVLEEGLKIPSQSVIQLRVLTVLKNWVGNYSQDFEGAGPGEHLTNQLHYFLDHIVLGFSDKPSPFVQSIKSTLEKKLSGAAGASPLQRTISSPVVMLERKRTDSNSSPNLSTPEPNNNNNNNSNANPSSTPSSTPQVAIGESNTVLIDNEIKILAQQLALLEGELFCRIQPKEFFKLAWSKNDKESKSPNILAMIRRFNLMSNWVCAELVFTTDLNTRILKLKKLIQLATESHKLNNFNGALAIVAGLENTSVHRLKKTWEEVTKMDGGAWVKSYGELKDLSENNYHRLRKEVKETAAPCIPYLGMFLTDLTFMEEGNQDKVDGGLVNFYKLRLVADKMQEIIQCQMPYGFPVDKKLQEYFRNYKEVGEEELYDQSSRVESKKFLKMLG
eukprot:TRINITY_DN10600_c0_g1_i1.p1 TRINITY_DN10600_c0_g1~~TRINITY_DN10600_c0_g1_i1.p1  ORF type:complete len:954 (-),score=229.03 TRINITY_DN10600_c0_g1_i1:44-2905(-)